MSSRPPTTSQDNDTGLYYPTRVGLRYGMMAETQVLPSAPHTLPPPAMSRPRLPPPSHLEPSFVPQSPQTRPEYSDLSTRATYPPLPRQPVYGHPLPQDSRPFMPSTGPERLNYGSSSHPALFPQRVSYSSTNPGTIYEASSPVDYPSHGAPPETSMFNEGSYTTPTPYPLAGLQQLHQSPASSYHSSGTSSSGLASAQIPFSQPGTGTEPSLQSPTM